MGDNDMTRDAARDEEAGVIGVVRKIRRHADYSGRDLEATSRLAFIKGLADALIEHLGDDKSRARSAEKGERDG